MRWLRDLGDAVIDNDPGLALLAGWMNAVSGRPIEATRWSERIADVSPQDVAGYDPVWFESLRAMVRSALAADGVRSMKADAELAVSLTPMWDTWRPFAIGLLAVAEMLQGEPRPAELRFGEGIESARAVNSPVPQVRMHSYRALARMEREDWTGAAEDVEEALGIIERVGLGEYAASALAFAAAARLHLHRRDHAAAASAQLTAMRLRPLTTWTFPWFGVQLRLELAKVQLAVGEPDGAAILLREIDEILHHRPSLGTLNEHVDRLRDQVTTRTVPSGPTLSAAELRVLPYLQTNLNLREIGERLFISRNTVNSHVRSICRKLQVSGRSEAVNKSRAMGLLASSSLGGAEY